MLGGPVRSVGHLVPERINNLYYFCIYYLKYIFFNLKKLPDFLCYIRLWLTINARLILYLENTPVLMVPETPVWR